MTEQELIQENEKLTARLKKAVEVFNEQKATITRQAEEIESLKQKAAEGEKKDNEFFEQVNEIEKLKEELTETNKELTEANNNYFVADKKVQELTVRIAKATSEYKKLKEEYDITTQTLEAEKAVSQKLHDKINKLKLVLDE